jgi:hypothetical protein
MEEEEKKSGWEPFGEERFITLVAFFGLFAIAIIFQLFQIALPSPLSKL